MNLDTFLTLERRQLLEERQWLERRRINDQIVPQQQLQHTNPHLSTNTNHNHNDERHLVGATSMAVGANKAISPPLAQQQAPQLPVMDERTQLKFKLLQQQQQQQQQQKQHNKEVELTKDAKEAANKSSKKKPIDGDWVTDTFYAYFPGFSNEYEKRQLHLRERQRQNQENFLKHFPAGVSGAGKENVKAGQKRRAAKQNATNAAADDGESSNRTSMNATTARSARSHDKTELEIIVTNPNYVAPKYGSARPGSTRHKLLQDLQHTELSHMVAGDGVTERNRRSSEMETARKKDYQRELMQQIEEKRRSIEALRDSERKQDEALTKRLQEQLSTLRLEEALEQERLYANKLRADGEQSRLQREELIAKLEEDSALLLQAKTTKRGQNGQLEQQAPTDADADSHNKVYQYFSNSAEREYRRGQPLPQQLEVNSLELPLLTGATVAAKKPECGHTKRLGKCPLCETPLQCYESCCARCQQRHETHAPPERAARTQHSDATSFRDSEHVDTARSFSLICTQCERLYTLCRTCLAQKDICASCYCQRSVCLSCRRALCPVCLDTIVGDADARDAVVSMHKPNPNELGTEQATSMSMPATTAATRKHISDDESSRPPYSMHIERNSIFHPDFDMETICNAAYHSSPMAEVEGAIAVGTPLNIERVRKETDKRLSHYFKHYGDLALLHSRSTQTTPESAGRRDIVLHEEHNLSMPLLREMPKMTRDTVAPAAGGRNMPQIPQVPQLQSRTRIEQLKRRWEVPAVQKYMISTSSPKVLTQVGAIRKQLQAADFI